MNPTAETEAPYTDPEALLQARILKILKPCLTTEIGSFLFFGISVPVYCTTLAPASGSEPAETRTFSGSLTVANEWA